VTHVGNGRDVEDEKDVVNGKDEMGVGNVVGGHDHDRARDHEVDGYLWGRTRQSLEWWQCHWWGQCSLEVLMVLPLYWWSRPELYWEAPPPAQVPLG
jgi:hypothetical protein